MSAQHRSSRVVTTLLVNHNNKKTEVVHRLCKHVNNSKKTKQLLGFQKPRKKSAKTRTLGFLGNHCAQGGGDSRKPTKNQGENQGSRKPSVLVGFLRQKKGLCIPSLVTLIITTRAYIAGFHRDRVNKRTVLSC
jgi:hypothetical protein